MRQRFLAIVLGLALGAGVGTLAQTINGINGPSVTGTVNAADTGTCALQSGNVSTVTAGCVILDPRGFASFGVRVSGTWTGTLNFEACLSQCNNSASWFAAYLTPAGGGAGVSSTTANGTWSAGVVAQQFRVRMSGSPTGAAQINLNVTMAPTVTIVGGGGGTPGGVNGDVQCNDAGVLGACDSTVVYFDGTSLVFPDPSTAPEGATKNYVDTQIANLNIGGASQNSFLVSGGQVTWASSLVFTVSAASYYLNGTLLASTQGTVTLSAADPTNPRLDLIGVNASGVATNITGTAASTPSEPSYDPSQFLPLAVVSVPANATVPPNVVNTLLYQSDVGSPTEWNWSVSGTGIVANSTNNPLSPGTHTIEATAMASGAYAVGQIGSGSFTPGGQNFLILWIQSKATWPKNRTLVVQMLSSGVLVGSQVTLQTGAFGFNSATTGSYQQIAIPITQLGVTPTQTINQVKFLDQGGAIGFYIGLVEFQGGLTPINQQGFTQAQADARYIQLTAPVVVTTSQTNLSNAMNLGSLATGALIGTVSAGSSTISAYAAHTCTNQAVTALSAILATTCTTITSAYVNNSIALTGTDINTSNQVTATHLASALPVAQGGTACTSAAIGCVTNITGATGSPSSTTYLRGDDTWATVSSSAPGGSSGDVQCNVSSVFGACATGVLTYSSSTLFVNTISSNTTTALTLETSNTSTVSVTPPNVDVTTGSNTNSGGVGGSGSVSITTGNVTGGASGASGGVALATGNANSQSASAAITALPGTTGGHANGGGVSFQGGPGGSWVSSLTAGQGGTANFAGGTGGSGSGGGNTGGIGGAAQFLGGTGGTTDGSNNGTAGAGGTALFAGGTGGGITSGITAGAGGNATFSGGNGGAASASSGGTRNGGNGGNAIIEPGAGGSPGSGGTAGTIGNVQILDLLISGGTKPTYSACGTASSLTGGSMAGSFVCNATSAAQTMTFVSSATNGIACHFVDVGTLADANNVVQTGGTANTVTMSGTVTSGDKIIFHCFAY